MRLNKIINYNEMYFYTDSHNDLKLMEFSTKPIAVDPDSKLKKYLLKITGKS